MSDKKKKRLASEAMPASRIVGANSSRFISFGNISINPLFCDSVTLIEDDPDPKRCRIKVETHVEAPHGPQGYWAFTSITKARGRRVLAWYNNWRNGTCDIDQFEAELKSIAEETDAEIVVSPPQNVTVKYAGATSKPFVFGAQPEMR